LKLRVWKGVEVDIEELLTSLSRKMLRHFKAYEGLRAFREAVNRDTTVLVVSIQDLAKNISSPVILNALIEGRIIYDKGGLVKKLKDKVNDRLKSLGIRRVKEDWG